jgi:hypothetical protein
MAKNIEEETKFIKKREPIPFDRFFNFEKLITHSLIKGVYFLGVIGITLLSILAIFIGSEDEKIYGFLALIFGNLLWRIVCELMILIFNIHETLKMILAKLEKKK